MILSENLLVGKSEGVIHVNRFNIKRDDMLIPTNGFVFNLSKVRFNKT